MRTVIILLLILTAAAACWRSCYQERQLTALRAATADTIRRYRDAAGRQHAVTPVVHTSPPAPVKKIMRQSGITEKNIREYTTATTVTADTLPAIAPQQTDTGFRFHYEDKWISILGQMKDSLRISYQLRDSLWFVTWHRKAGLFRKVAYMDGFSANPHTVISGLKAIRTDRQAALLRVSIGPQIGWHYAGGKFRWSAGIGIQYNLIRF
ncbi:hypothetical protein [Chitinophaga solisilvae]|uniref:hypothetical protein n=1 Tax=Chitinophaga solisilvae TaxID=1233460 RepID=UPI001367EB03|nr:hypothetical protein [Chitinophaga solisilvae]